VAVSGHFVYCFFNVIMRSDFLPALLWKSGMWHAERERGGTNGLRKAAGSGSQAAGLAKKVRQYGRRSA